MESKYIHSGEINREIKKKIVAENFNQLTDPQSEIITSCIIGGDDANRAFNQSISIRLKGGCNEAIVLSSLNRLVQRNESLRMTFDLTRNHFVISDEVQVTTKRLEHQGSFESYQEQLETLKRQEADWIFNLEKGPLFKFTLFKFDENLSYLILTFHHIVCDGWTLGLIYKELSVLYSSSNPAMQEEPPMRFSDYAVQEHQFHAGQACAEMMSYWQDLFKNYTPASPLPYNRSRKADVSFKSKHISYPLPKALFKIIKASSEANQSSVLITLASVFEVLLYRLSGVHQFVIGISAAGQPVSGFNQLMGHCVYMLPVKTNVDGHLSFGEYLQERKQHYALAFKNRRITFGKLLKAIDYQRGPGTAPLIPVSFNIDRPLSEGVVFEGLETELEINKRGYSSFEIIMNLSRKEDEIIIEADYNEQLFDEVTIKQMLQNYESLIQEVCENNSTVLDRALSKSNGEFLKKLSVWNNTGRALPEKGSFIQEFEKMVIEFPHQTALEFLGEQITYDELNRKSNRLASHLINQGIQEGHVVGIAVERSAELMIAFLAVMKTGAIYLPIDPEFPAARIQHMIADSGADSILVTKADLFLNFENTRILQIQDEIRASSAESDRNLLSHAGQNAYLLYTSGSTGKPKGVLVSHLNLLNLLLSMKETPGCGKDDRLLAMTTISFDIAGLELFLPLISGATLVLAASEEVKDANLLIKRIKDSNITILQATPSMFKFLLAADWKGHKGLKLLCGGESLNSDLAAKLLERCESLWNMYGPTETTIWSSVKKIENLDQAINIGKPIHNTEFYILDTQHQLCPEGVIGEICIGGAGVSQGYFNQKELTDQRFIDHPLVEGRKIYKTGDLGKYTDQGEIICLGRNDAQLKIRGYRIEAEEIEKTLVDKLSLKDAAVLALKLNNEDERLLAFLIPEKSENVRWQNLNLDSQPIKISSPSLNESERNKSTLEKLLPEYMVPAHYFYLDHLPLTPNQKIDRQALKQVELQSLLHQFQSTDSKEGVGNTRWNAVERKLKPIWESTLKISNIGLHDNFFSLGGHSLIAIELMNRIEEYFQIKLPMSSLFSNNTIALMAKLLQTEFLPQWKFLVPIKTEGSKPPLYIVHGAGLEVMVFHDLADCLDKEQPFIGIQAMGVDGITEPKASIEEIAAAYIEEMLVHNPKGPYNVAGFSSGIVIAYEIARQLDAQKKKVSFLGNFDFSLENLERNISKRKKLQRMISQLIPRQIHAIKCLIKFPSKALKFQWTFIQLRFFGLIARLGVKHKDHIIEGTEHLQHLIEHYQNTLYKYELKPYFGDMELFNSKIKIYYLKDKINLGWRKHVKGAIHVHYVEGDHDNMILPPNCQSFALELQRVLDENNTKYTNETNSTKNTNHQ